ncbi:MAG: undecaprenyl-diphosphate phosphatase [Bacilli bacterium]|nr:undecaprenyl-diphosphate phosphatase [Bacilli bacterium]
MDLLKYLFLGLLQGITEPLPISSSGHIYIFKAMFNTTMFNDLTLEIFLNFASFIAIFIIFKDDIIRLLKGFFEYIKTKGKSAKEEFRYCMLVVIGTIPVGLLGLLVKDPMENLLSKNVFFVGIGFFITAIALLLVFNANGDKQDKDITYQDAIVVGLFQVISLLPGISRSGLTLVGCLLRGMDQKTSLRYSFMLYFPVSLATMLIGVKDFSLSTAEVSLFFYYLVGMAAAGVFTYLSYNWLTKIVEKGKLWRFSIYLFAVALFSLMFFI